MNLALKTIGIAFIAAVNNTSCAQTAIIPEKLQLSAGQIQIWLEGRNGACYAMASRKQGSTSQRALEIPWPCRFHTDKVGNIRTLQEAGYVYALIESSRQMPKPSRDCETYLRSLRVKGSAIELSQHKERVASCPPFQWDKMMFKELFD